MRLNLSLVVLLALFCHSCMSSDPLPNSCPVAECIYSGNTNASSANICNSCTLKLISDSDKAARLYQFQQKLTNADIIGRTRLTALNADVLMLIYDELDLQDMTNLLSVYPSRMLLTVARDSFRIRYKDYTVVIDENTKGNDIDLNKDSKWIQLYTSLHIANVLRFFGSQIQNLEVSYPSTFISQLINKYTANSLIELKMNGIENNTFPYFTKPFKFVEVFSLRNGFESAGMPLNQLFPSIKNLQLDIYRDDNLRFLACEYPHLEHLTLENSSQLKNKTIFSEFFKKNPQIRSLKTTKLSQTLCDIINEHVPQIQNLTTCSEDFRIMRNTIFPNVKRFAFEISYDSDKFDSIKMLNLPKLEHLQIEFSRVSTAVWINFCKKHKHLKHLEILNVFSKETDKLMQVIDKVSNLTEITLEHNPSFGYLISVETISRIIQSSIERSEQLVRLNFRGFYLSKNDVEGLRQKLESEWNIIEHRHIKEEVCDLSFEKKN